MHILFCVNNIKFGTKCFVKVEQFVLPFIYGLTKALGVNIEPEFGPDRAGDIKHSNADISKAKKLLDYDPDWSFEKGIATAIDWYKANL